MTPFEIEMGRRRDRQEHRKCDYEERLHDRWRKKDRLPEEAAGSTLRRSNQ